MQDILGMYKLAKKINLIANLKDKDFQNDE